MKHSSRRLLALLFCCLFAAFPSLAQRPSRDAAKEEKFAQELARTAPKAVDAFKSATVALDQENYPEASRLYAEVIKQAPNFEPALRRGGLAEISLGRRDAGLKLVEQAVKINRSPENLSSYALALTDESGGFTPGKSHYDQAFVLMKEAAQKSTEKDADYLVAMAQFALSANRVADFQSTVRTLRDQFPDLAATHYFNGLWLANEGELDGAAAEIKRAAELGAPAEMTAEVLAAIEKEKSERYFGLGNYFYYGGFLVAAWAVGLVLLFAAGKILSAKTLRSLENSDPNDIRGNAQAGLRGIYKKVIGAAGIYYYLSQPVVILLVIAAAGGIVLFFFWIGTIPIKLVLVIGFIALATVFYMLKSLVIRAKIEDPGRVLPETEAPELWRLVRDVARTIDTRPVNEIRITHGSELAVYERGGVFAKMQDRAERVLIIGVATLNGFSQNAFRAVLAHEYGHFSNRDTAGGDVAMRVNHDIMRLAESMALSGTATFYNIAFQFLRFYHFVFRRITHGASRLQEILADRVAAYHFGAAAFREGLEHVIRRELEFDHLAEAEINAAMGMRRALNNLYELKVESETVQKSIEQQFSECLLRPTTEDDTHPSPVDRFRLIRGIKSCEVAPLAGEVWELFPNREALTREMNDLLEARMKEMM